MPANLTNEDYESLTPAKRRRLDRLCRLIGREDPVAGELLRQRSGLHGADLPHDIVEDLVSLARRWAGAVHKSKPAVAPALPHYFRGLDSVCDVFLAAISDRMRAEAAKAEPSNH